MKWYRVACKVLTKSQVDSGRTKHWPIETFDVYAKDEADAWEVAEPDIRAFEHVIDIRLSTVRVLKCELNEQQMALHLQYVARQYQKTPAGKMKTTESGLLVPKDVEVAKPLVSLT
jgi:hypothetical protein